MLGVQCEVFAARDDFKVPSHLSVSVHCVIEAQPEILEHFVLPSAVHFNGDDDFDFQQRLASDHGNTIKTHY